MKKGQEFEAEIMRMDFPNRGICVVDDETILIKNALPGQKVRGRITKKRGGRLEARILEVLETPSEGRENPCPHAGTCGGCLYQGISYERELEIKKSQIERLLAPVIGEKKYHEICEDITASPRSLGYRNKMELTFGDAEKDGPLTLGMHARGSFYDITATTDCRIMTADMRMVLKETLSFFRERGISYYHRRTHRGYLRHLLLRQAEGTGEFLIDLVTSSECITVDGDVVSEEALLAAWRDRLLGINYEGMVTGILHTKNDGVADTVADEGTDILYGRDFFNEHVLGLEFQVSPFSFFQTNSLGAEVLYRKAREYILDACGGELGRVFDLYSGTGTIAQVIAPAASSCIGVEIVPEAVTAAEENARKNGLDNVRFVCGDVLKVLDELEEMPDTIILDPPRDGIHPKALPKLINYGVANILYISCKATSLARDLPVFMEAGYHPTRLGVVDMFPRTGGVETVVSLSNKNVKPEDYVEIGLDAEDYYRIKDAEKESAS